MSCVVLNLNPWPVQTGLIDYEKLEEKALDFRPQMIICGGSAYPREWDYPRLRAISDKVGAFLMADMAHIRCGLLFIRTVTKQLSSRLSQRAPSIATDASLSVLALETHLEVCFWASSCQDSRL